MLRIRQLSKMMYDTLLFKNVQLDLVQGEVVGLVGQNGVGKTTLLNMILGIEPITSGNILWSEANLSIGYLSQSTDHLEPLSLLSGGEKTKKALTNLFNESYSLLLLDEPTNHLDEDGVEWLISLIKSFFGGILIVSHDRYFLDQVVTKIALLDQQTLTVYPGNYTAFRNQQELMKKSLVHQYEEQKKHEHNIDAQINQLKQWSQKAHRDSTKKEGVKEYWRKKAKMKDRQVKSATKRLEKLRTTGMTRPKTEKKLTFEFENAIDRGNRLILAQSISKRWGKEILFQDSSFSISKGDKVGIIGKNGCGKTTLLNLLLGTDTDYSGELWISPSIKIAYLSQDVFDLDEESSLMDLLLGYPKIEQTRLRTLFASIGLTESQIKRNIGSLSLGERMKSKLILLIFNQYDCIILDEPTNHLDLDTRVQLEKTLQDYQGTLLIVSHDRYFLETLTNHLLVFEMGKIIPYNLSFRDFKESSPKLQESDILLIEHRIALVLSELSICKDEVKKQKLDAEFQTLIQLKRKNLTNKP